MNSQLQCKELREGNTVLKDGELHTVTRRDLADGAFVKFKGVALTSDTSLGIMKRLGFSIRKAVSGEGCYLYFLNEHMNANRPVTFVHQLQNLHLDITGVDIV
jgi:hypothetical protein